MSEKTKKDKEVQALTTKEIKALTRPKFEKEPEKYYPVQTLTKIGFSRAQCPKCKHFYWRHTDKRQTCGDSTCEGKYEFIGIGTGIGEKGKKITYAEAWKTFEKSLTHARIPCTAIERYPVVARWRSDVDYVAAGIYCFQPYCVTGELDPPANPLICPQFSVRFNDLDNIGLTGRHYSGFIMLGIQVFNYPGQYHFFKEECTEFNYNWLTQELGINPDDITFIEDVWAGGGNCGPCIEYFIRGLEVGDMVFTQFKTYHDGTLEELPITIIDTGIGLERIPWLINGSATSYMDTFKHSFEFITKKLNINLDNEIWTKFGPYSCLLNIDEVEDIDKTWEFISEKINVPVDKVKEAIAPIKDIYIILDHIRTVFMIINDGSLPSNVGGGANVRNILRRVFSIIKKQGWDKIIDVKCIDEIIDNHILDMEEIYGKFEKNPKLDDILQIEYDRWLTTDKDQKTKLDKLIKKKGGMTIDDWIVAIQSYGIPADRISEVAKIPIPGNLYYEIAQREERIVKAAEQILYDTSIYPETDAIFYQDHHMKEFDGKILAVFTNLEKEYNNLNNIVILDRSAFYPLSGGQDHDTGTMTIDNVKYNVVNVQKVGKCALHVLDKELPGNKEDYVGKQVHGEINMERRIQLMSHHTACHIIFASAKKILGPHVWQNGAKKTEKEAHLDITHYKSLTYEEEQSIQNMANQIVLEGHTIKKGFIDKAQAEKDFGFTLYQGGVVPGNQLRVVNIQGVDVEACCGTHHDNTTQVGYIKITKTKRISDGIVRIYFVAYQRALEDIKEENEIIHNLCDLWGIERSMIFDTAKRFFTDVKKYSNKYKNLEQKFVDLQVKNILNDQNIKVASIKSDEDNCQIYISQVPPFAKDLIKEKKGVVYYNDKFIYALFGDKELIDEPKFKEFLESFKPSEENKDKKEFKFKYVKQDKIKVDKKTNLEGIIQITCFSKFKIPDLQNKFKELGFKEME